MHRSTLCGVFCCANSHPQRVSHWSNQWLTLWGCELIKVKVDQAIEQSIVEEGWYFENQKRDFSVHYQVISAFMLLVYGDLTQQNNYVELAEKMYYNIKKMSFTNGMVEARIGSRPIGLGTQFYLTMASLGKYFNDDDYRVYLSYASGNRFFSDQQHPDRLEYHSTMKGEIPNYHDDYAFSDIAELGLLFENIKDLNLNQKKYFNKPINKSRDEHFRIINKDNKISINNKSYSMIADQVQGDFTIMSNERSNIYTDRDTEKMYLRLKGKIILKVEDFGKAYYINPKVKTIYYLGKSRDALAIMREQGVGITNTDLEKIPIGVRDLSGADQDGDRLSDMFEDAIGTDKTNKDTDGDGYDDKTEVLNSYSPKGNSKTVHDTHFAGNHRGKIFLQIESRGEAWYVNPADGKRYFLGRPVDALAVMRNLGIGISNSDFDKL